MDLLKPILSAMHKILKSSISKKYITGALKVIGLADIS